jgi:hypothetical protein
MIDRFKVAACVSPNGHPDFPSSERAWNQVVQTSNGQKVTIVGFQGPGARVVIQSPSGKQVEVASPGDYIYPMDVRYDFGDQILYVRADGLAGGISKETWLFAYDISKARQTARMEVDPRSMPPVCPSSARK